MDYSYICNIYMCFIDYKTIKYFITLLQLMFTTMSYVKNSRLQIVKRKAMEKKKKN